MKPCSTFSSKIYQIKKSLVLKIVGYTVCLLKTRNSQYPFVMGKPVICSLYKPRKSMFYTLNKQLLTWYNLENTMYFCYNSCKSCKYLLKVIQLYKRYMLSTSYRLSISCIGQCMCKSHNRITSLTHLHMRIYQTIGELIRFSLVFSMYSPYIVANFSYVQYSPSINLNSYIYID